MSHRHTHYITLYTILRYKYILIHINYISFDFVYCIVTVWIYYVSGEGADAQNKEFLRITVPVVEGVDGVVGLSYLYLMFVFWECIRFE